MAEDRRTRPSHLARQGGTVTKNFRRKIGMIWRLARRGAWSGVRMFSGALVYGLTHRRCKQCGVVKGFNADCRCCSCQYKNLMIALSDEYNEETP